MIHEDEAIYTILVFRICQEKKREEKETQNPKIKDQKYNLKIKDL
jgi:hypothetical protein